MSLHVRMPPVGVPPVKGVVVRTRRRAGHFVNKGEPLIDIKIADDYILTICSPLPGKVMRELQPGTVVEAGQVASEVSSVGTPTREIFLAYRRRDSAAHVGRLADRLKAEFGEGQVFEDIGLTVGVDYVENIRRVLQRATVMLVVIGPRWLNHKARGGGRQIDESSDLHREEIRTALERRILVVPVLVGGAKMPRADELPPDIQGLARRQKIDVSESRWDHDASLLADALVPALLASPRREAFVAQVPKDPEHNGPQWIADDPLEHEREMEG